MQAVLAPVSSLQVNVAGVMVEENENDADVALVGLAGLAEMVVSGAGNGVVTETVAVRAETFPAVSRARTA